MLEEEKLEIDSNSKFKKGIYVDSKVVDKFWIEDSDTKSSYGKPVKGKFGTEILNECYEKVILLMRSVCPKELTMEGEVISDGSDAFSFDDETMMRSMVLGEEEELNLNGDELDTKLSGGMGNGAKTQNFQDIKKKTEVTSPMASYAIDEPKSLVYDQEDKKHEHYQNENIVAGIEVEECFNISQHCSGPIPYSGSLSLRSTSSTASTQSFAFPILAQEWSSSPVRMVKPDKRHSIKRRLWRKKMNWICCNF